MLLSDFLTYYATNHETGVRKSTIACFFKPAISDLEKFLHHPADISDLNRENINSWITTRQTESVLCTSTIKTRRNAILALWRSAFDCELTDARPEKLRKIRSVSLVVEAWTPEEIACLIKTICESRDRKLPRVKLTQNLFLKSLILAGWDTGLRLGDLLSLRASDIRRSEGQGHLTIVQNKTLKVQSCIISRSTLLLMDNLMSQDETRELYWPLWCNVDQFYRTFKGFVRKSGIRPGTFRWIRRASITTIEANRPGAGTLHAGHSDPRVTHAHYLDKSQLLGAINCPPPLKIIELP